MIGFSLAPDHESQFDLCHIDGREDNGQEVVKRLVA
jgi:hypothetical protein